MAYELTIVRTRKNATVDYPAHLDHLDQLPLAGPFDPMQRLRLMEAVRAFPYVQKLGGRREQYEIEAPNGGRLVVFMTSDGHLFFESQAGLELALALFCGLLTVVPDLALEDPTRGVLHDPESFRAWIDGDTRSSVAAVQA